MARCCSPSARRIWRRRCPWCGGSTAWASTRVRRDYTEDPADITEAMRSGRVAYLVNTRDPSSAAHMSAGRDMRRLAIENNVITFTSLDTVQALLDVLEAISSRISTIDA